MKLDEHFKSALKQAVGHEPPVIDPRGRFEARLSRTHRMRFAVSAAGLAAVAVAAVLVVPRVLPESNELPLATQEPTAKPTAAGGIDTTGWNTYSGNGWTVKYSPKWKPQMFEGDVELVPTDLKGTAVGEPTFALIYRLQAEAYTDVTFPPGGETTEGIWNDGHKYRQWRSSRAPGPPRVETVFEYGTSGFRSLHVIYYASTQALWDANIREADATFNSLAISGTIKPVHGTLELGVESNAHTRTLVDFMDARIIGRGAEAHLWPAAKQQYDAHQGGLSLYSPTSNPHYARYVVLESMPVEGNVTQARYLVRVAEEYTGQAETGAFYEWIDVGPVGSGNQIISARRCETEC